MHMRNEMPKLTRPRAKGAHLGNEFVNIRALTTKLPFSIFTPQLRSHCSSSHDGLTATVTALSVTAGKWVEKGHRPTCCSSQELDELGTLLRRVFRVVCASGVRRHPAQLLVAYYVRHEFLAGVGGIKHRWRGTHWYKTVGIVFIRTPLYLLIAVSGGHFPIYPSVSLSRSLALPLLRQLGFLRRFPPLFLPALLLCHSLIHAESRAPTDHCYETHDPSSRPWKAQCQGRIASSHDERRATPLNIRKGMFCHWRELRIIQEVQDDRECRKWDLSTFFFMHTFLGT